MDKKGDKYLFLRLPITLILWVVLFGGGAFLIAYLWGDIGLLIVLIFFTLLIIIRGFIKKKK